MPLTNTFAAIVVSVSWLTNYIERPPEGPRGNVWYRTNVVSVQTVVAIPGVPNVITNPPVAVTTNTTRLEVVATPLPHLEMAPSRPPQPVIIR